MAVNYEDLVTEEELQLERNRELVAVITAAIAASMGTEIPKIKINSIKRVPQYGSPWARIGKIERLLG